MRMCPKSVSSTLPYRRVIGRVIGLTQRKGDALGRLSVNVVASPMDSTEIVPPCALMIDLVMASPRPLPSVERWREGSTRKKRSNTRCRYSD